MKPEKIYISCPMSAMLALGKEKYLEYQNAINVVAEILREDGTVVFNPADGIDITKFYEYSPQDIRERDFEALSTSQRVIAFVDVPSLGVGVELGWAEMLGIPITLVYSKGFEVSGLAQGLKTVDQAITYPPFFQYNYQNEMDKNEMAKIHNEYDNEVEQSIKNINKPGEIVLKSGQVEIISPKGRKTGDKRTVVKGESFPPTPKPGQSYEMKGDDKK
ncbi:MAG: nucleoside 2-deoxyribosyltransferase [Dehalococcoidales bacterium]|nr:nucleoside 2-deoxyribosyltransferase [Dehalococcoidales bacterium]